ncbi:MAG: N-6 DNA methylase [Candidatus Delongbacteria bacterium]|nr:N-6 DNA methylase [Candidatus Delongbacteria bacterium]
MKKILELYLKQLSDETIRGDAREESFYPHLSDLMKNYADNNDLSNIHVTTLPKKTEAGNPDFRIWDGKQHIVGYIEAKTPDKNLDQIETSEQLKRYRDIFPNLILTNFYEFRLYRNGELAERTFIGRPFIAKTLKSVPPVENSELFSNLLEKFFSFTLPKVFSAESLALELAKRTRFLKDEVIYEEIKEETEGKGDIIGFYEAFKTYLVPGLSKPDFADLYAQTITYGLFASRTRSGNDFNRELAFKYIPSTIGILRDVFRFISLGDLPDHMKVIIDDISEVLLVSDIENILRQFYKEGKGKDPIIHFYETFLTKYDPAIREKRGVYYTPEPAVKYIVRAIHSILKSNFDLSDGLASEQVKLLDPAGGTLTFPAEAIKLAAEEYVKNWGTGGLHQWISNHILKNFYAFELMMAPYAVGHLKMGLVFDELGYKLKDNERFKLYLTNTLEMEEIDHVSIPGLSSLTEESRLAGNIKKSNDVLVILGNPPYSGNSANSNKWTESLLKDDLDGAQSYYKVDGNPLGEKNPKWLQDDYVKFLRFAQWKIQKTGHGIVGMITNHSYLDNPTFRGMRQSLMKTFDEIYILDLHGNSLKKETAPDGSKDENIFDIRQGVAIVIFIRNKDPKKSNVYNSNLYGLRDSKYDWLEKTVFSKKNYTKIEPLSPYYFFIQRDTKNIEQYSAWIKINDIFPLNSVGVVTARDKFVIGSKKDELINKILQFRNLLLPDEIISETYNLKDKKGWSLKNVRRQISELTDWVEYIKEIEYRPFDKKYIFYNNLLIERMRFDVMRNMLEENIGLVARRQQITDKPCNYFFISDKIISDGFIRSDNKGSESLFPLYIYKEKRKKFNPLQYMMLFDDAAEYGDVKVPNIDKNIYKKLNSAYKKNVTPEDILYYIYAIFYSNIYRETFSEYLKVDFPRVPFTADYEVFKTLSKLGNELAGLHLLKSPLLDKPTVKYQGTTESNRIDKILYNEKLQRIYINEYKYFDNVSSELWNYYIGGYQVLHKYLKDRKGMLLEDTNHYCRIATALGLTIIQQNKIDSVYPEVEKILVEF